MLGCGADGVEAGPQLVVEGVFEADEGTDVGQDFAGQDAGDGGVGDAGEVRDVAQGVPAGAEDLVEVAGQEQAAVGAERGSGNQVGLWPVALEDVAVGGLVVAAPGHGVMMSRSGEGF